MPTTTVHDCWAVTAPGVEPLAAAELTALGLLVESTEPGGVAFRAPTAGLYAANLQLRTASRVVVRLGEFHASTFYQLEERAARLPWETVVPPGAALRVRVTSRKSRLYHQHAVAERVAGAVAARVAGVHAAAAGDAGGDDEHEGDEAALVLVRLLHDRCTVSIDSSGALLHRRGYRLATAKAPLRETLAAAMLLAVGWDGSVPLLDPFCGAGTIPIEAALLARRIPPGLRRGFAFERWPAFDAAVWRATLDAARAAVLPHAPAPIQGSDRDAGAIEAATANAARAGVAEDVRFRLAALSAVEPPVTPAAPGWLVTNPPYGIRVGERRALRDLFAQLGHVARRRLPGWHVAFLSVHPELERQTALPLAPVLATSNGGIGVRLVAGPVPG